jgi:hypothetical protein
VEMVEEKIGGGYVISVPLKSNKVNNAGHRGDRFGICIFDGFMARIPNLVIFLRFYT